MEKIQPGKFVEIIYDLYQVNDDKTEKLVHQSDPSDPERFVFGVTKGMIAPLEKALESLAQGDSFDVSATADEAFGPYDPEQIVTLEKDLFEVNGKFDSEMVKEGKYVPMMTADGYRINGLVKEVTDKEVVMDFNHPLAGKNVRFDGKVTLVRDATPEELHPACGCGCGQGGDGGCGDGQGSCGQGGCCGGCQ